MGSKKKKKMVEQRFRTPAHFGGQGFETKIQKLSKTSLLGKVSHALSIAENAHVSILYAQGMGLLFGSTFCAEYSPPMRHNVPLTGLCYVS